ncbi:DUF1707 SHOCT-like domain-containing protein [Propionibacteriaceae bacterium Y1685]|uniref:DUF1707 SHOCT-like domain-containing protein n=1 Tax=Microlunatus sp. Y1700 TaxID=3418487 RepID=UPI003B7A272E
MDPMSMRAGDQDRATVLGLLRQGVTEGRLGLDELAVREEAVSRARTFGDLDAIVADLPVPPPSQQLTPVRPPGAWPEDAMRLQGGMSSDKRVGRWIMPEYIEISGGMGTVKLDCLQAICDHQVVHIRISGGMGTITFVVPHGWAANIDRLNKGIGTVRSKVPTVPDHGLPLLRLIGDVTAATVTVRHAGWLERRRLRKAAAKGLTTGEPLALPPGTTAWVENNDDMPNSDSLR